MPSSTKPRVGTMLAAEGASIAREEGLTESLGSQRGSALDLRPAAGSAAIPAPPQPPDFSDSITAQQPRRLMHAGPIPAGDLRRSLDQAGHAPPDAGPCGGSQGGSQRPSRCAPRRRLSLAARRPTYDDGEAAGRGRRPV